MVNTLRWLFLVLVLAGCETRVRAKYLVIPEYHPEKPTMPHICADYINGDWLVWAQRQDGKCVVRDALGGDDD